MGISFGEFDITPIGGFNDQYTYIMTGSGLQTVGNCLNLAAVEELVICSQVYEMVGSEFATIARPCKIGEEDCVHYLVTMEKDKSNWQVNV